MKTILKKRILDLGRGEEGVALVVTLAVFMFMYIFCAGVFAVGKMVKDRICLQNAADAAAYSAAVVQADTLSRIATINRAMSWTYAQMNKRRMDFIVHRWIEHTLAHYQSDVADARSWVLLSQYATGHNKIDRQFHRLPGYYADLPVRRIHGTLNFSSMTINSPSRGNFGGGGFTVSDNDVLNVDEKGRSGPVYRLLQSALTSDGNNFDRQLDSACYYNGSARGIEGLQAQIDMDMRAIALMNQKEVELMSWMPNRIDDAATGILRANVPDFGRCGYVVRQDRQPTSSGFFEPLRSSAENEFRFLEWGNTDDDTGSPNRDFYYTGSEFESGEYENIITRFFYHAEASRKMSLGNVLGSGGRWFPRLFDAADDPGFARRFVRPGGRCPMSASWSWLAWYCPGCSPLLTGRACVPRYRVTSRPGCSHSHGSGCGCRPSSLTRYASLCEVDNQSLINRFSKYYYCTPYYGNAAAQNKVLRATPWIVGKNFFSGAGTITVGIARPNDNPWRSVLGKTLSNIGLYHAFDPYLDWMVCFASARAGYKIFHLPSAYEDGIQEYEGDGFSRTPRIQINQKVRVFKGERDYCIDWKESKNVIRKLVKVKNRNGEVIHGKDWHWQPEWVQPLWRQSWNLRQSDWDAVMIPVCRAASGAEERTDYRQTYGDFREPCWGATDPYYLWKVLRLEPWQGVLGATTDPYRAGSRQPQSISDYGYIDYEPGDLAGLVDRLPERYRGWYANRVRRGGTSAIKWPFQWRVSGFGQQLDWVELQKHMLH